MEILRNILNKKVEISDSDWLFISSKLQLKEYKKTQIITINQFEQIIIEHNA